MLPDPIDRKRAEHQALRARLLAGEWASDLEEALGKHIRPERRSAWGIAEMSRNPFRSLANQVGGTLYQSPPTVRGLPGSDDLIKEVESAGFWQTMQSVSTDLVGLREALVRVDWSERGGLLIQPVPCELAYVEAVPEAPDVPALVEIVQQRTDPVTGKPVWVWEVLDIRDLANPKQVILSKDRKKDLTSAYLGGDKSGKNYQYRDSTGKPYLPICMYHAERTGRLWNSRYGLEAVLGTLTVGVLMTFWIHGFKDGSFVTVALVNGRITGLEVETRGEDGETVVTRTQVISTEPGSFIEVSPIEANLQPSVLQLQPGFDPQVAMAAIGAFESGLAEYAGVSPADLVRTGADPRSGASLAISREGLRAAQARYEPQLRRGDLEVLSVAARVLNGATGSAYPESGYSISYPSLPLSAEEVRSQREDLLAKQSAGLLSQVDVFTRLNPGVDAATAVAELARVAAEKAYVERATALALREAGVTVAPPVIDLEVGKAAIIPTIVAQAMRGEIPVESATEILIAMGVDATRAAAIMGPVSPRLAPTPTI